MHHFFTIAATQPFTRSFIQGLLARYGNSPLTLSSINIFLPNNRSIQAVKEVFINETKCAPLLLPKLLSLGDSEAHNIPVFWSNIAAAADIHPPISADEECVILAQLIRGWRKELTFSQSLSLAGELSRFIGEVYREQLSFDALKSIVPSELANHWQITLDFLKIITRQYPLILQQKKRSHYWEYHTKMVERLIATWQETPPDYPVIIAGSTGSAPTTAKLIHAVNQLPLGTVILPGFDTDMDAKARESIPPSHPQHSMNSLTQHIDYKSEGIKPWHELSLKPSQHLPDLLRDAHVPAAQTGTWYNKAPYDPRSFASITLCEAKNQHEEAYSIALMLRETLETPHKKAALITHDSTLAANVIACLKQWKMTVDYSAGIPLGHLSSITFLHNISQAIASKMAPIALLTLLKHPFCCIGESRIMHLKYTRELEKKYLRGVRFIEGIETLIRITSNSSPHLSEWLQRFQEKIRPLLHGFSKKTAEPFTLLAQHLEVAESICASDTLWSGDKGEQAHAALKQIQTASLFAGKIAPYEYPGYLMTMLKNKTYRPSYGTHPRLAILAPMESRMQSFERVILGGLNEGSWPPATANDPWMSRPMRQKFGLPDSEKKIGMAAHDFTQCFYAQEVILTRSLKVDNVETMPTRWIMRLKTLLSVTNQWPILTDKGNDWLQLTRTIFQKTQPQPIAAPRPSPAIAARPVSLPVTAIEKLMRDPYMIYAQRILKLKKLDPLEKEPSAAEFGIIIHEALENFTNQKESTPVTDYENLLLTCGKQAFKQFIDRPAVHAFWWPRFKRIARWIARHESQRNDDIKQIHAEISGECHFGDFTLTAKADRIEMHRDGSIMVIDYKTGTPPSLKAITLGYASQLTLISMMSKLHAFDAIKHNHDAPINAEHWKLSGTETIGEIKPIAGDMPDLIDSAQQGVSDLMRYFSEKDAVYLPSPDPRYAAKYNDYLHLSRQQEWQNT